jgi:hypothetical protein
VYGPGRSGASTWAARRRSLDSGRRLALRRRRFSLRASLGGGPDRIPAVAERKDLVKEQRKELLKDEVRMVNSAGGIFVLFTVIAVLGVWRGHADLAVGAEAVGISAAAYILVVAQRFASLRDALVQGEARIELASRLQALVELLESIDKRLARIEQHGEKKTPPT